MRTKRVGRSVATYGSLGGKQPKRVGNTAALNANFVVRGRLVGWRRVANNARHGWAATVAAAAGDVLGYFRPRGARVYFACVTQVGKKYEEELDLDSVEHVS
jgi:hypothetical protein